MKNKIFTVSHILHLLSLSFIVLLCQSDISAQNTGNVEIGAELLQEPAEKQSLVISLHFDIPSGLAVYTESDHFFEIRDIETANLGDVDIDMPETGSFPDILSDEEGATTRVIQGEKEIRLSRPASGSKGDSWQYRGALQYQACSEEVCFPPETYEFSFAGIIGEETSPEQKETSAQSEPAEEKAETGEYGDESSGGWKQLADDFYISNRLTGYTKADKFLAFLEDSKEPRPQGSREEKTDIADYALWLTVLIILLGGLALNLTPCVLPMIPVNLAIIGAGSQSRSRWRGVALGAVYGLAIALTYGILGAVVVLTGATFGAINASPWFNLSIAIIFVLLGIAVLGAFRIDFSSLSSKIDPQKWSRGAFVAAFLMGGLSALLAGACVAPIVIAVLVLSTDLFADGNFAALLYPFILGLGMGLPWPIAGAGISFLPKPGRWMNGVKYIFGIFILGLAIYYGWTSYTLFQPAPSTSASQEASEEGLAWHTDLQSGLQESKRADKPVFIDFWASWCKNCHLMEKTTFRDPEVVREMENFVMIKYQAEKPDDEATKEVLEHFNVMGLPTYIVLHPEADSN